jgi:uncharacterized membrane protein HdeD (DUF308 family)
MDMQLFLIRGLVAIAWAAAFAAVADSLTAGVAVAAGILVVLYPLIDTIASLIDARTAHGSGRRSLLANAATSAIAAIALGVAATASVANVLAVFGVWAAVSGAAQLVTALRRRALYGRQWPMRLAGAGSVIFDVAFVHRVGRKRAAAEHARALRRHRRHRLHHPGRTPRAAPPPPRSRSRLILTRGRAGHSGTVPERVRPRAETGSPAQ